MLECADNNIRRFLSERRNPVRQTTLKLPQKQIAEFCRRWDISALALFGSVLRPDFRPDSDVDILVTFADESHWTLLDCVRMEQELAGICGRPVDLVSRRAVEGVHSGILARRCARRGGRVRDLPPGRQGLCRQPKARRMDQIERPWQIIPSRSGSG